MRLGALLLILFSWLLFACPASANCTTPCTKAQITTDINTNWPDNTTQLITPALLRSTVLDLVNSYVDINGTSAFTCAANQFMTAIATLSTYTCAQPSVSNLSGLGTGVATALGTNVGSAGAFITFNGAGGTPSSITLTNGTGLPANGGLTGIVPSANGGTGINNGTNTITVTGSPVVITPQSSGLAGWSGGILGAAVVGQFPGTATNDNANAGNLGELIKGSVVQGSAVALTTGTPANIQSISLTAGDWDVEATCVTNPAGTTTTSSVDCGVNTTSATQPDPTVDGGRNLVQGIAAAAGQVVISATNLRRFSLAATTTVFQVVTVTFATSTMGAYGMIRARRVR